MPASLTEPRRLGLGAAARPSRPKELSILLQESYCHVLLSAQEAPQRHTRHTERSEPLVLIARAG